MRKRMIVSAAVLAFALLQATGAAAWAAGVYEADGYEDDGDEENDYDVYEDESEEETGLILSLEDMDMTVYAGTWFTIAEAGVELYLPGDWAMMELSEEDENNGVLYSFRDSITDPKMNLVISWQSYEQLDMITGIDDLYAQFISSGSGCSYAEIGEINTIPVVTAQMEEEDAGIVAFFDSWGDVFVLTFAPVSDPAYQAYMADIICSMCLVE